MSFWGVSDSKTNALGTTTVVATNTEFTMFKALF